MYENNCFPISKLLLANLLFYSNTVYNSRLTTINKTLCYLMLLLFIAYTGAPAIFIHKTTNFYTYDCLSEQKELVESQAFFNDILTTHITRRKYYLLAYRCYADSVWQRQSIFYTNTPPRDSKTIQFTYQTDIYAATTRRR